MSAPLNSGEITLNKPLTKQAAEIAGAVLGIKVRENAKYISIDEYYSYDMEEDLQKLCDQLTPLGYVLSGSVGYYGDWGDGTIEVNGNSIEAFSADENAIRFADDQSLIDELESRGYTVTKQEKKEAV